jgi:RNA polymerase sigma-70 factor, ECF subfamily
MSGTAEHIGRSGDQDLVVALRAGDEQTFAALVDEWSGWMLRRAREHVPTTSAAEEVVQETWMAVLEGLTGFRGESSLRTWVYTILVNQARSRGVRERRSVPFASLAPEDLGASVDPSRFQGPDQRYPGGWQQFPEEWPEDALLAREVHRVVSSALAALPPRQRAVVTLRDIEGHSAEEVSTMLDITTGNQRVLLHRGRSVVRAQLEHYFATQMVPEGSP